MIGINLFLSLSVYPSLLQYQAGSNVGHFITKNNIPTNNIFIYKLNIPIPPNELQIKFSLAIYPPMLISCNNYLSIRRGFKMIS